MKLEDSSLMPFGTWKGRQMADVPADYLIHLFDNGLKNGNVKEYIEDNMDVLYEEINKK